MSHVLSTLSSSYMTLIGLVLLGLAVIAGNEMGGSGNWVLFPMSLLALNLLSVVLVNKKFQRLPALLGFHLCLLVILLLVAWRELVYFEGRLEIVEDTSFDPKEIEIIGKGPFHTLQLPNGFVCAATNYCELWSTHDPR